MLENFIASLWVMLWGMLGIFIIIGIIFICVVVMQNIFKTKKPKEDKAD
ncbi:MAG: hypothetical protein WCQ72_00985 [Eubacteriales bacterium]